MPPWAIGVPRHIPCFLVAAPAPTTPNRVTPVAERTVAVEPLNLTIWLPGLFLLGLATMGLMFAFAVACEKV
jgi:hypothetical protein